ncbi:adhesion G protein-coupled receptor L2-like [Anneissia japonica]|uniref:adhesion G protein-coupled receptor L2-like n=1 Tax=Anneissia japonica TaxID=1529436 RepID=UPI0014256173|nr:adhesion G protein-coupled receptor L2-like [Anneissia japonica]
MEIVWKYISLVVIYSATMHHVCTENSSHLDRFAFYPEIVIMGTGNNILQDASVESCVAECLQQEAFNCRSFVYIPIYSFCFLNEGYSASMLVSMSNGVYLYERIDIEPVSLFELVPNSALPDQNVREYNNALIQRCAKLCLDSASFYCVSFEFQRFTFQCWLSSVYRKTANPPLKSDYVNNPYDYYELKTIASASTTDDNLRSTQVMTQGTASITDDNLRSTQVMTQGTASITDDNLRSTQVMTQDTVSITDDNLRSSQVMTQVSELKFTVGITFVVESPEVFEVPLTSDPNSVTFSTSVVDPLEEDGPFKVVASVKFDYDDQLETVNWNKLPRVSEVVTINIYDRNQNEISIGCKIHFPIIKDVTAENTSNANRIPACHYKQDINDTSALWSSNGCVTDYAIDYMVSGVTCICTHLTSFVILMKPNQINNGTLSVLTTVGVSISNVFLITTLVTICGLKGLRNLGRYKILRHLVIALLCVNFFFLLLEADVKNTIACGFLAGCLHYSLLVAFSWMLIMSTDVYMKIKHPFADHERRFLYSRYIGWIGPFTIVGTTVGITRGNYASNECWLESRSGAIWAFVSPLCLTILIVLVELMVVGYIAFKKSQLPNQTGREIENLKRIRTMFIGILLLTPAVGISWIFGVIIVFCDWEVLKYIYVIFNSMQGFFIWLSQCAFSKEVREALIKKFSHRISQDSTTMELRDSTQ